MVEIADNAARTNCAYWATEANVIHLQKGNYSFAGREYLMEPMCSTFKRIAMMKGTQGGASLTIMLMCLWGMIYKHFQRGVLYLFPTATDVREFSQAVLNPLLAVNKSTLAKWVKTTKRGGSDTTTLKQVNGANFFMRGAGLKQIVDGQVGEAAALKGISTDILVADEVELFDQDALAKARGRMDASVDVGADGTVDYDSSIAREVLIGNPGIPGYGIDKIHQSSDQRHWFRRCGHCSEWTCAELDFPDCVKIRPNGRGYIACSKCGKEVFTRDGEWVPKYRDKSDYMHGYRWSQLTSPCPKDPGQILDHFNNPPENNLADVYRIELGLPFVNAENRLTTPQVYNCCGASVMRESDRGPCAFGLDVGKICHLVIGKRIGTQQYEIIKIVRLPGDGDWHEISEIVEKFNCISGVIDIRPYESAARRFQKEHRMRIFLCEYSETTPMGTTFNKNTGIVKVNRTEICDSTHSLVATKGRLTLPKEHHPEMKVFATQVCDPAKVLEVNKKTKQSLYRYKGSEDHYRHALNYFLLASEKLAISKPGRHSRKKHTKVMNDYARI
jgi:hypothetical protein